MTTIKGNIRIETDEIGVLEGDINLNSTESIGASRVVAYNDQEVILKWQLLAADNSIVYKSGKQLKMETCIIDLKDLPLTIGANYKIKAAVTNRDDKIGNVDIKYDPNGGTIYFGYDGFGGPDFRCQCYGNINSLETPPVVKASSFFGFQSGLARMRWNFNCDGETIYSSGSQGMRDNWEIDFRTLSLLPGTRMAVKANVSGGSDSTGFFIIEYDPTSTNVVKATYSGNIFRTVVMYSGIETV